MRHVIESRQAQLGEHPFFRALERCGSPSAIVSLTPALTFWCRAVRDVLEAGAVRVAQGVRSREDLERCYFEDVERLVGRRLPSALVASDAHPLTREASYQLLYEVLASKTDGMRLVLLGSLDATRDLFCQRVAPLAASLCDAERRLSFEQYRDGEDGEIASVALSKEDEEEALALVDRVFTAFHRMFDGFVAMHA